MLAYRLGEARLHVAVGAPGPVIDVIAIELQIWEPRFLQ
jgi:hypothetical protein